VIAVIKGIRERVIMVTLMLINEPRGGAGFMLGIYYG
jgi:hypothetical protein